MSENKKHIISILLENESGALSRVAGLFSARGFNIESLSVSATEDPSVSRMTIITTGSEVIIEQITKHLNKLIDVVKLINLSDRPHIERQLMLIKIAATNQDMRNHIQNLAMIFRGKVMDVTTSSYVIEMTGDNEKMDALIDAIGRNNILEVVRSGVIGISRGERSLKV